MSVIENLSKEINARITFYIGKKRVLWGNVDNPDETLESVSIIFSQVFDSLKDVLMREITIKGDNEYVLLILKGKEIFGFVLPENVDKENVLRLYHLKEEELFDELFPKKKPEVLEEVKKVEVSEREVEKKPIEKIEVKEEKVYPYEILSKIREVSTETLGDFAIEIFDNIVNDLGIKGDTIKKDKLMELINELEKSAKMIVGPTKASNMRDDILKQLKEV